MSDESPFSAETQRLITNIEGPVTADEPSNGLTLHVEDFRYFSADAIDCWVKFRAAEDKSHRLRTMLDAWKDQQGEERRLRSRYAGWLLFGLFLELVTAGVAFFLIGRDVLSIDTWVANVFFAGVFGQVASMVLAVVRYLFPDKGTWLPELIERL